MVPLILGNHQIHMLKHDPEFARPLVEELTSQSPHVLLSKLLKGGCIGDYIGFRVQGLGFRV